MTNYINPRNKISMKCKFNTSVIRVLNYTLSIISIIYYYHMWDRFIMSKLPMRYFIWALHEISHWTKIFCPTHRHASWWNLWKSIVGRRKIMALSAGSCPQTFWVSWWNLFLGIPNFHWKITAKTTCIRQASKIW